MSGKTLEQSRQMVMADRAKGKRTIVQIAAVPSTKETWETLYALCDDGTVWKIIPSYDIGRPKWRWLPKIPQGAALDGDSL